MNMKIKQFEAEIKKLPIPPNLKKEFTNPKQFNEMIEGIKGLSDVNRNITFNFMRLFFYREFIRELGYLPSALIIDAVGACSVSIRTMKQLDQFSHQNDYKLLSDIRGIGEGIVLASQLEKSNRNEIHIRTYSEHEVVKSLDTKASAGDCFLFNVMIYATGRPPFKDIPISPVVEHYFDRLKGIDDAPENHLPLALDLAVKDVFGEPNPLFPRVSEKPRKNKVFRMSNIIIFSVTFLVVFIIF